MSLKLNLKSMTRAKIKTKILRVVLGLSLIALVISAYISIITIDDLTKKVKKELKFHDKDESALWEELQGSEPAIDYLQQILKNQAIQSQTIIRQIVEEVNIMAEIASLLQDNPNLRVSSRPIGEEQSHYLLASGIKLESVKPELERSGFMDPLFIYIHKESKELLDCLAFTAESGFFRYYPSRGTNQIPGYDPRKSDWYRAAVEKGDTIWTPPRKSKTSGRWVLTCAKPFFTFNSGNRLLGGVVKTDIRMKTMYNEVLSSLIRDIGYVMLMDEKGRLFQYPGQFDQPHWKKIDSDLSKLENREKKVDAFTKYILKGKDVQINITLGETDYYIAFAPIPSTKWFLGIVTPLETVTSASEKIRSTISRYVKNSVGHIGYEKNEMVRHLIYFFVVMILLVVFLGLRFSKKITSPIEKLDQGVHVLGKGNLDHRLNIKSGDELENLSDAFNQMAADLKLYMKNLEETTAAKERIESDLRVANQIQASMLPRIFPPFPNRKEVDIYALMDPAKEVGGDFYDFFFVTENKLFFLIADVTGKGVPASLFMAISKTLIKNEALRDVPPLEVLNNVNKIIIPDNDESMFVTVFCAVLDVKTGELQYGIAGHNPPLLYRSGEDFQYIKPEKSFVLGVMDTAKFATAGFTLKTGDTLFLYSDGVTEAMNENDELFSEKRLQESLGPLKEKNAREITLGIKESVADFVQDAPQSDDLTILVLRFKG